MFAHLIHAPFTMNPTFAKYSFEKMMMHSQYISVYANQYTMDERIKEAVHLKDDIWFESAIAKKNDLVNKTANTLGIDREYTSMLGMGLEIEDDILIMHEGKLEASFVAFASSWSAGDKQGKTLRELHEPIADGDKLRNASDRIIKALTGDNCYHRYTWGVSPLKKRSNHPRYEKPDFNSVDDLWFRVEHERTISIEKNKSCALLISVDVFPLGDVLRTDGELLKKCIDSMSDNVLVYKNLKKVKRLINDYARV